jgi:hypothetical protein
MNENNQIIVAEAVGGTTLTKTFVSVQENEFPKNSVTIQVSSTFSGAKLPNAHQIKSQLTISDKDKLRDLIDLLTTFL